MEKILPEGGFELAIFRLLCSYITTHGEGIAQLGTGSVLE